MKNSAKLAINGGKKVREIPFEGYNTIGIEEEEAVVRVLRSKKLSSFLGTWHNNFYGGKEVKELEELWSQKFGSKYAISVNSATSGLFAAVGALGIEAGDEIIVSPYTMSASAVACLVYGAIPIFADIDDEYFCLDPKSVESKITHKTKAIIVVDLFGQPYDPIINEIAKKHNLFVIEDAAQAPGAMLNGKFAGTLADIGVYSLNYHKHVHSGEGGVIVTNSEELAFKLQLIRNHAEAVLGAKGINDKSELINMIGYNYRMTEIEASIAKEQLKKLDHLLDMRIDNVKYITDKLKNIPFLTPSKVRDNAKHAFYVHTFKFDKELATISRDRFVSALKAELPVTKIREDEGVLIGQGYVKPLYMQPIYQHKIAYGKNGYPFSLNPDVSYEKGICPVCESMHYEKLITHELFRPGMSKRDLDDVIDAFYKVTENIDELR